MKNGEALSVMEYIDGKMIEEADAYQGEKKRHLKWEAIAACLCLGLVGASMGYSWGHDNLQRAVIAKNDLEEQKEQKQIAVNHGTGISGYDDRTVSEDMAMYNGKVAYSHSLLAALEHYGDDVTYRVVVEVFQNGTVIYSGSSEVAAEEARLTRNNYTVIHEETARGMSYFTMNVTKEQLLRFPVNISYGYYIALYDEYLGLTGPNVVDQPVDETDPNTMHATEYPDDILEMQDAISQAMTRGELPFVYGSSICEDPLRIEVDVNTTDEKLIEKLIAVYDPGRKYMVVKQGKGSNIEVMKENLGN